MTGGTRHYPFSAIIGQERMKKALVLNVICPSIGGVLICGEKGTAKSTAVRSLAKLLPQREVVDGCRCHCSPSSGRNLCTECAQNGRNASSAPARLIPMDVVELPLNATEDRVAGSIDIETALREGVQRFEPGVLARANGNILYIDEINLLDDHIIDMLLDAAAMGVNHVEREGISFRHQSRFVLVGTMNPEEGDIRPQLLDRFGIVVDVCAERDVERRMEIVHRRLVYDRDPILFAQQWEADDRILKETIAAAVAACGAVRVDKALIRLAAEICIAAGVDGHRADVTIARTAAAIAAYEGRGEALREDIIEAATLALPHRTRRRPFAEGAFDAKFLEQWR